MLGAQTKKATEQWLLDEVASQNLALALSKFRDSATSIGCLPRKNQQYQYLAGFGEFSLSPSPAVFKP
jgi:hypothetical protein